MKPLLLAILLLLSLGAHAQPTTWTFAFPIDDVNGVMDVATGSDGNVYVTGRFTGSLHLGNQLLTSTGAGPCLYIAKCSPGGHVLRVTKMEGADDVLPRSIVVDEAGNSYVTGAFRGTLTYNGNQRITAQSFQGRNDDAFLVKCGPTGRVRWVSQADGGPVSATNSCFGVAVAVDEQGNSYITGGASGDNIRFGRFSFGPHRYQGFVASYDQQGQVRWVRVWNGLDQGFGVTVGQGVVVDKAGNCYVSGNSLRGWTLDGIDLLSPKNTTFLAKFNTRQGQLLWSKSTPGEDDGRAIAIDKLGDVCFGGSFTGTATFGSIMLTSAGSSDGFVARYDPNGDIDWATALGGPDYDVVTALAVDQKSRKVFATGLMNFTPQDTNQSFLQQLNANGRLQHLELVGGPGTSSGGKLAIDNRNNIYSVGVFTGKCRFGALTRNMEVTHSYFARYGSRLHNRDEEEDDRRTQQVVSLFPNPAQQQFTLRVVNGERAGQATLYNQMGMRVATHALQAAPAAEIGFDTSALPDGLYVLRLESQGAHTTHLVKVQH